MRIQHFVVLTVAFSIVGGTGFGEMAAAEYSTSATVPQLTVAQLLLRMVPVFGIGIGFAFVLNLVSREWSGWSKVVRRFPGAVPVPGDSVQARYSVQIGNVQFGRMTLRLTSAGVHLQVNAILHPPAFIPYSAIQRIMVRKPRRSTIQRFVSGSDIGVVYGLLVDYPVHFRIGLLADDFEFARPFVTAVPMEEDAT